MTPSLIYLRQNGLALSCSSPYRSLLDALEAHQVLVEFQCRSGYCGACRLRLLAGEVKYHQQPLAFVGLGQILPCCCLPVDDIELEL
ncbi:MAG: class I ribonucleotide reductase maintenance protein YfaE [Sodalis sp. (in: enterobacteria)]